MIRRNTAGAVHRNANDGAGLNDETRMNATNVTNGMNAMKMNEKSETNEMTDGTNANLSVGLSGAFDTPFKQNILHSAGAGKIRLLLLQNACPSPVHERFPALEKASDC